MRNLYKNPIALVFALLVVLYSIGVSVPVLGRNPCTRHFAASVYVVLPSEGCYIMGANGWQRIALP
jgi:hypothetical protein